MTERLNYKQLKSVVGQFDTVPTASADWASKAIQYMGTTTSSYEHGYIYECKSVPADTLVFTPDTVSCSWADLRAFLEAETASYNSVVSGAMTYVENAELWRLVFKDANGDTVLTYQQYTGDWENIGFVFSQTFEDGDVVSFFRNTTATYLWERIDVQPNSEAEIAELQADVAEIQSVIPAQASALNQLADKIFVNSSIATNTATFRGTYNSLAELEAVIADENDYGFVVSVDAVGNTVYNRYKYTTATTPASWAFEYALNNSSFTATQWAAINSNATAADIAKIATALQPGDNVSALTNDAGYLVMGDLTNFVTKNTAQTISGLKTFTGDIVLNGTTSIKNITNGTTYSLLWRDTSGVHVGTNTQALTFAGTNTRPTYNSNNIALFSDIPTAVSDLTNDSGYVTNTVNDLQYYTLSSNLATVATTGAYSDLIGLPALGTAAAADTTDFATAAQGGKADTAIQPLDNVSSLTNDAGYLTVVALSGLTDVAISSLVDGQSLIYDANAGKWKNVSSSVSVGFAVITGSPDDNVALKAVLDSKSGCVLRRW